LVIFLKKIFFFIKKKTLQVSFKNSIQPIIVLNIVNKTKFEFSKALLNFLGHLFTKSCAKTVGKVDKFCLSSFKNFLIESLRHEDNED
jgi:hypothetical protein